MKRIIPLLAVALTSILIFSFDKTSKKVQTINPVIGNISFIKKFGHLPGKNTDENLRIKTHLEYVEHLLRNKDVSNLSEQLKNKRNYLLNLLHTYLITGIFPRNYDHSESRKPCFIDKDNRICAVGYLIEKTAGRKSAEEINSKHKYDELLAMNDKAVDNWIATSGLTKEECAMIQPTYGPPPVYTYNQIPAAYGISSSALGGINLSLNAINALQILKGSTNKTIPTLGLVAGAGQVILGIAAFPKNTNNFNGTNTTNESKKTLSMVNIAVGSSTMILSAWNLINKKKQKDRPTSVNLYSIPVEGNKMNLGVSFTKRI
jgi:hypothetical protein